MNLRNPFAKDIYKDLSEDKRFELHKNMLDVEKIRIQTPQRLEEREVAQSIIWSKIFLWSIVVLTISLVIGLAVTPEIIGAVKSYTATKNNYIIVEDITTTKDKLQEVLDYKYKKFLIDKLVQTNAIMNKDSTVIPIDSGALNAK